MAAEPRHEGVDHDGMTAITGQRGSPREQRKAAYTHQDLVASLVAEFPEFRGDLEDPDGALHAFALFTQAAKGRGDLSTCERCLKLADRLLAQADAGLSAAFRTSYLEHLDFEGSNGPAAWRLVPPRLQLTWNQLAAENRRLMALPQDRRNRKENPPGEKGQRRMRRRGRR
jgi:hypothetical protein